MEQGEDKQIIRRGTQVNAEPEPHAYQCDCDCCRWMAAAIGMKDSDGEYFFSYDELLIIATAAD